MFQFFAIAHRFVTNCLEYDGDNIIFEDPSMFNRGFLAKQELEDRWHDLLDDEKTAAYGVGVVVRGEPKFGPDLVSHID